MPVLPQLALPSYSLSETYDTPHVERGMLQKDQPASGLHKEPSLFPTHVLLKGSTFPLVWQATREWRSLYPRQMTKAGLAASGERQETAP